MARLGDISTIARTIGLRELARRVWHETFDDNLFLFAAALAYAWLFAIFPFCIFLLTTAQMLSGGKAGDRVLDDSRIFLCAVLPDKAAGAIWESLRGVIQAQTRRPALTLLISSIVTLWAASGGVTVTMAALDRCYEQEQVRSYYKRRPMALGLTILVSALSLAVVLLVPIGSIFREWVISSASMKPMSFGVIWAFDLLRGALALMAGLLILALIYHWGPCVKRRFRTVTPGSAFCMIAWVVLALVFKFYVNTFSESHYQETYGAAGWVWILLVVLYLDALVLLIGAEINSEIEYQVLNVPRGSKDFKKIEKTNRASDRLVAARIDPENTEL